MENLTSKEIEAGRKLRSWLGFENDDELLQEDFDNDYLTVNGGRDDKVYVWYLDENYNAAINVDTLEIISDEEEIDELFNISGLTDVKILMLDGCTKADAEKHLEKGTVIYFDLEERLEEYLDEWSIEEDEREPFREMIRTGAPVLDWGVVKKDGKAYYIQYCL